MKHLSWFSYSMKVKELLADFHYDKFSGLKLTSHLGFAINQDPSPSRPTTKSVFFLTTDTVFYLCNSSNSKCILHLAANMGRDEMAILEVRTEPGLLIAAWVHLHTGSISLRLQDKAVNWYVALLKVQKEPN